MGGSPRPMEPMGPHRPRALKYTPTGGSLRPIGLGPWNIPPRGGPRGPSALAHRPWPIGPGPWSPWGPPLGPSLGTPLGNKKKPTFRNKQFSSKKYHPPQCSIILCYPRNPPGKFIYQFFSLQVTVSTICAQNIDFYEKVNFEKSHFSKNGFDAGLDRSKNYAGPRDRIPMKKKTGFIWSPGFPTWKNPFFWKFRKNTQI